MVFQSLDCLLDYVVYVKDNNANGQSHINLILHGQSELCYYMDSDRKGDVVLLPYCVCILIVISYYV